MGEVFQRYFHDWQRFSLVGLGAVLAQVAGGIVAWLLGLLALGGSAGASALSMYAVGGGDGLGLVVTVIAAMGGAAVVMLVAWLVVGGLVRAGLVGAIVAYRRGEDVGFATFWSYATRYAGKMVLLGLIYGVILLVSAVVVIFPLIGQIVYLLWLPTAFVTLGIYPAYLIIHDGYGVVSAVKQGLRILERQTGQTVLGGLIMALFYLAGSLLCAVPIVNIVGALFVAILGQPLVYYFFVERFESEVRPQVIW